MTDLEKAKAYDEALKRAREAADCGYVSHNFVSDIFPELKESEDERIRKLLIWQVHRNIEDETNDLAQSVYDGIKGHDPDLEESIEDWKKCLAYLEKQKEQKPNISDEAIREGVAHFGITQYQIDNWLKKHINIVEQKPAEWSEEDERIWKSALWHIKNSCGNGGKNSGEFEVYQWFENRLKSIRPQPKQEWSEEDERKINRIYEILGHTADDKGFLTSKRIIGDKEAIELQDFLKSLRPQQKREWSEEDEDKVDDICKLIEHATIIPRSGDDDTGIPPTRLNDKYKGELKAFVKSLRNRPTKSDTWKPSEGQMEALLWAAQCPSAVNHKSLTELYNDLKKLI